MDAGISAAYSLLTVWTMGRAETWTIAADGSNLCQWVGIGVCYWYDSWLRILIHMTTCCRKPPQMHSTTRAVYPEHNQSSILTLSVPKWQVPTQKQNDPTDDASATRSDRGNRGTSYPCLDWIKTTRTMSLQIPVTVSFLLLVVLLFISSTHSTCGLLCTVSVSGCISTI